MKYEHSLRTNFFHVNDEETFVSFMATVVVDKGGALELNVGVDQSGRTTYGFTCDAIIIGAPDYCESGTDEDVSYDSFILGLQECVAEGDAIIILEFDKPESGDWAAGYTVVTADDSDVRDIVDDASDYAMIMLDEQKQFGCPNC